MDIKEYISSGIIEAYVMGLASEEEIRILDCVQKNNPEVKQAILDAQNTLEDFASQQAIAPPPALKSAIWAKISEESQPENLVEETPEEIPAEPITAPLYPSPSIEPNKAPLKWFAIAASILLIASVALNLYLNGNQNNFKNELASLKTAQKENALAYQNLKSKWDLVTNPTVKAIPLLGVEKHPEMKAMVYFEQHSKEVYLALDNLPMAPKDQQYQLWAIVDGKPVSLGMFDQDAEAAVQKMISVTSAQAFAITLEKRGGSPKPTMENMYVMGKV